MGKTKITEDTFGQVKQPGSDAGQTETIRRFTFANKAGVRVQVFFLAHLVDTFANQMLLF